MPRKIEISHRTIIFTVILGISLWLLYYIRRVILQFFVALLIMAILNPLVTKFARLKIPRAVSILLTYICVFGLLGAAIGAIVPALVDQTTKFIQSFPFYLEQLQLLPFVDEQLLNQLTSELKLLPAQALKFGVSVFEGILSLVAVFIFSFYLLVFRNRFDDQLKDWVGKKKAVQIAKTIDQLESKLGSWARGQLILMFLMGILTYIGITLLRIPFALPLAVIVGIFEIIPVFGPIFAAIPMVIVGFGIQPVTGLAVIALSILLHQVEQYVLVPNVMHKQTGINPIITLLVLIVGFKIAGVVGAVLSVPIVITLQVISKETIFSK